MKPEIRNAKVRSVSIEIEDHNILTAWLHLDYGSGGVQGFGGYCLDHVKDGARQPSLSLWLFVTRVLEVFGVYGWEDLAGKSCRVVADHAKAHKIGHFMENRWFDPTAEFIELDRLPLTTEAG